MRIMRIIGLLMVVTPFVAVIGLIGWLLWTEPSAREPIAWVFGGAAMVLAGVGVMANT